jgi:hypothetical protein
MVIMKLPLGLKIMRFKGIIKTMLYITLISLSIEILVRRNMLSQIPTQISRYTVYAVLTINLLLVLYWSHQTLKVLVHKTKQDKN